MFVSNQQARRLNLLPKKASKYHNTRTLLDGIRFDSAKEADYYCQLKILQKAGQVIKIELQPKFELQEGFTSQFGKERPIIYKADFKVFYKDGHIEVVDVKGFKTKEYNIKRKVFLYHYPQFIFKEVH